MGVCLFKVYRSIVKSYERYLNFAIIEKWANYYDILWNQIGEWD